MITHVCQCVVHTRRGITNLILYHSKHPPLTEFSSFQHAVNSTPPPPPVNINCLGHKVNYGFILKDEKCIPISYTHKHMKKFGWGKCIRFVGEDVLFVAYDESNFSNLMGEGLSKIRLIRGFKTHITKKPHRIFSLDVFQ